MSKTKISQYSQTASQNTDINSININEGCPPSTINNAIRELMKQIKDFQVGAEGDGLTVGGAFVASSGATISGALTASNTATLSGIQYPTADGTSGQVLATNGSGVLSFSSTGDVTTNGTQTLTNKTIVYADNTLTGVAGTTATQTLTNKTLTDPAIIGTILEDVYTISDGAAFEIDPGNGSIQLITLGANRTPKATNFAAGEAITLMVDDGSARTLTWTDATFGSGGVVWQTNSGTAPTLATSGYTVIVLWKVGTQVYGAGVA